MKQPVSVLGGSGRLGLRSVECLYKYLCPRTRVFAYSHHRSQQLLKGFCLLLGFAHLHVCLSVLLPTPSGHQSVGHPPLRALQKPRCSQ